MILNTVSYGQRRGEPFLAIHGLTAYGGRFRRLAEEELAHRRVLAVDLRGHGRSGWDPPWHLEQHVDDVRQTLDAHGVVRCDVIGHSYGACIAVHLAVAAPERVGRLLLLDPAIGLDAAFAAQGAAEHLGDESWSTPEEARSARLSGQPDRARWGYEEDIAVHLERCPDGRYRLPHSRGAAITAWSEMTRPLPDLSAFPGSVLLVAGRRSPFVRDAQRAWLEHEIGDRLSVRTLDCGHNLYWEAFEETARAVSGFLATENLRASPNRS